LCGRKKLGRGALAAEAQFAALLIVMRSGAWLHTHVQLVGAGVLRERRLGDGAGAEACDVLGQLGLCHHPHLLRALHAERKENLITRQMRRVSEQELSIAAAAAEELGAWKTCRAARSKRIQKQNLERTRALAVGKCTHCGGGGGGGHGVDGGDAGRRGVQLFRRDGEGGAGAIRRGVVEDGGHVRDHRLRSKNIPELNALVERAPFC